MALGMLSKENMTPAAEAWNMDPEILSYVYDIDSFSRLIRKNPEEQEEVGRCFTGVFTNSWVGLGEKECLRMHQKRVNKGTEGCGCHEERDWVGYVLVKNIAWEP